jgi:conjugal transfer ATP-binding protein TraC
VDAVEEMQTFERHIVTVASTAIVTADSKEALQRIKREVSSAMESLSGLTVMADGYDTLEQYLNCLPFSGRKSRYQRTTFDATAKNLLPTTSPWKGSRNPVNVCANRYGGFVPLDLLDERASSHHCLILGRTRSGKSFGAQALVSGELKRGDELVVLDRGNSWDELVIAAGGGVTEIEPGADSINPFELQPGQLAPDPSQAAVMANIIGTMLKDATAEQLSFIPDAIAQTFDLAHYESEGGIRQETVLLRHIVRRLEKMNRIGESALDEHDQRLARRLARDLQGWIGDTPLGRFVDRPSTVNLNAKVLSFETKKVADNEALQSVGMQVVANLLMRWIMRDSRVRKRVIVEELKSLTDTPQAIATTVSLFATAAKYNTAMTVTNQGAALFANPALHGIVENTSIFLLFRLDPSDAHIMGERLNLSDSMVAELPRLRSVKGVYTEAMIVIRRADGVLEGGVVRIQASPLEYWHYTSDKDDKPRRQEAILRHLGDRRAAMLELASDWRAI